MLLLSAKKIRERENEMLIQGKNTLLRKRVEVSEHELERALLHMEKQVRKLVYFEKLSKALHFTLTALNQIVYKVELNEFELQIDIDDDRLRLSSIP